MKKILILLATITTTSITYAPYKVGTDKKRIVPCVVDTDCKVIETCQIEKGNKTGVCKECGKNEIKICKN